MRRKREPGARDAPSKSRPDPAGARAERLARAIDEPFDVRPVPGLPTRALEVRNPVRKTHYLALLPAYPDRVGSLCTCPDFARRGIGTCKHLEAAFLWLQEHPEDGVAELPGPPSGVWRAVDRALEESRRSQEPDALKYRRPGAVLFEMGERSGGRSARPASE